MHIHADAYPAFADVSANIKRLGDLGMEVHITEMDVSCPACANGNVGPRPPLVGLVPFTSCLQQSALKQQAAVYGGMLAACLENKYCKNFETWGLTDKYVTGASVRPVSLYAEV